ncbi:NAD-dependent epimerase/dehydratase family protein [Acidisoma silvae]|uniref:NAD-dependent epimerase/dehydratase family protein n=2 Tax=Acidisoma silvae TaxID=2802396 RepID=A0A963YWZ5_9PROT|nr:NAD-dependent epimerase/dehydratase family protein [Acidisoma silvae]
MTKSGYHLILGGCGFIGRAVARELASRGIDVVVAGRVPPIGLSSLGLPGRIDYRAFSLADADWDQLIAGVAVIHHYAWSSLPASANADPARDLADNVVPTLRLLDAMRRQGAAAPRLVFASSGGTVYGRLRQIPVAEDHPLHPITAYGVGKAAVELYANQYNALYGLDCRIARISNAFGAEQNAGRGQGAVTIFIQKALAGAPIEIWGDGTVTRDYIHVSDVARGLVALALAPQTEGPRTFNIGSGGGVSLNSLIDELASQLGRDLDVRRVEHRSFDVPTSVLDTTLARQILGWRPVVSFSNGIAMTIANFRGDTHRSV